MPAHSRALQRFDVTMMMEQYLDGPEVDVDIVLCDGKSVRSSHRP